MPPRQPTCYQVGSPRKRNPSTSLHFQDPIKYGEILCDVTQKKWRIGRPIGVGAFGEIYLASDDVSRQVGNDAKFVVKLEPHSNGPLFVEMNFYLRVYKEELVNEWKSAKNLKHLGIPTFYGFGSHYHKGERFRFIILPRLGDDLNKIFLKQSKCFHPKTAFTLAYHIMDMLEYVHSRGYVHSDIKGMNMVLGDGDDNPAPVYLLDYGLVARYALSNGVHKAYNPDGRKAEAGTLEFLSRDAHIGALSRRSDLESLGYNMVRWLDGRLPWERDLSNPELVADLKEKAMSNMKSFLSTAFTNKQKFSALERYLSYTARLDFEQKPDYEYCKSLFREGIRDVGFLDDSKLTFDQHAKLPAKSRKRPVVCENSESLKRKKVILAGNRKPCAIFNHTVTTRITRNLDRGLRLRPREFDWAGVIARNPEKKDLKKKTKIAPSPVTPVQNGTSPASQQLMNCDMSNPTPAMLKVMKLKKNKHSIDQVRKSRTESLNGTSTNLTPAMEEIIANRRTFSRILRSSSKKAGKLNTPRYF